MKDKAADTVEEEKSEVKDAEEPGASSKERSRGGKMAAEKRHNRKRGGKVPGMKAKSNPGKRARGGADMNPYTAAGNMSEPGYEKGQPGNSEGGKGADNAGITGGG